MTCCNDLKAGDLRHKITIERETETPDGMGGSSLAWVSITAHPIKAMIKPLSGGESLHAMRLEAKVSHRIIIRYRTDIKTSDRINYNGRLMQIRAKIDLEERHKWLELICEEGAVT